VYHVPTHSLHARRSTRHGAVNQGDTGGDGNQAKHFTQSERLTQQENALSSNQMRLLDRQLAVEQPYRLTIFALT
jgi:hypothetical protein